MSKNTIGKKYLKKLVLLVKLATKAYMYKCKWRNLELKIT